MRARLLATLFLSYSEIGISTSVTGVAGETHEAHELMARACQRTINRVRRCHRNGRQCLVEKRGGYGQLGGTATHSVAIRIAVASVAQDATTLDIPRTPLGRDRNICGVFRVA